MKRARWKKNYVNLMFLKKNIPNQKLEMSWNSKIMFNFIGKVFKIHNGKKFVNLKIQKKMLGYKFGEFHFTRANFRFKKK